MSQTHPVEKHFFQITHYHYLCFALIFTFKIPLYWHIVSFIFLSPPMEYHCNGTTTGETGVCPCESPIWNKTVFSKTVQTKFKVLCEREWIIGYSECMLYVGTLIGSLVFGFLSDKYGRVPIFSVCCCVIGITGCLVSAMKTATSYIFMRSLESIGIGGAIVTGYVLTVEYCGVNYRGTISALYHLPIAIGHMSLAGVSYLVRDCDFFQLILSVPIFLVPLLSCLLYESPKWLIDNDNIDKAAKVMNKIAKCNNTTYNAIERELEEYNAEQVSIEATKVNFLQIFKYKKLSIYILCMSTIYLICGLGYYGVSQYIGRMKRDIHRNIAISGLLLIPATIATIILLKILSRKIFLAATNLLSGVFMVALISIPAELQLARVVVASMAKACFFVSFIIVFLYAVELFPTGIRNTVLGVLSVFARVGQIIAPPINALNGPAAGVIFGISAILGASVCYPLPETKDVALPSTLDHTRALQRRPIRSSLLGMRQMNRE